MKMSSSPPTVDRDSQICCKMSGILIGAVAFLIFVFDVDSHMAGVQWLDTAEKVNYVRRSICILGSVSWFYGLFSGHIKFMRITFFVLMAAFLIPALVSFSLYIDISIKNFSIEGSINDSTRKISYIGKPMSKLERILFQFCSWTAVIYFTLWITHYIVYKCTIVYQVVKNDHETDIESSTLKTDMILFDSQA